jgi:urease accessory protein
MSVLRARGQIRLAARRHGDATVLADLAESGGYRAKFPETQAGFEAVIVNTGGGLLGGDEVAFDIAAGEGAAFTVTTQSAEKVYRALDAPARLHVRAALAAGAALAWLPLETILFSGARLARRLDIEMAADASLLLAESVVFGRVAMGEEPGEGMMRDAWRIRRGGRLVFAENLALDGDLGALLARPAIAAGARAAATVLAIAPDVEFRLDEARALFEDTQVEAGASAWNGMLVVRMLARDPAALRRRLAAFLTGWRGHPPPRSWQVDA